MAISIVGAAAALLSIALSARTAHATVITVDETYMGSKTDSKCSLVEAIASVNGGTHAGPAAGKCALGNGNNDTIVVPGGQYTALAPLVINKSVIIQGVGNMAGVGLILQDGGVSTTGQTAIRLAPSFVTPASENPGLFVLNDNGRTMKVTIEGILLAEAPAGQLPVSAVYAQGLSSSMVTVSGSSISGFGNSGIYLDGFSLTVANSHIFDNFNCHDSCQDPYTFSSPGGANGAGGGIFLGSNSGSLTVSNSTIDTNVADSAGGGIFYAGAGPASTIVNSTISDNIAAADTDDNALGCGLTTQCTGVAGSGGGLYMDSAPGSSGTFTIAGSTVAFNVACSDGAGVEAYQEDSGISYSIVDSIVADNQVGAFCSAGPPTQLTMAPSPPNDIQSDGSLTVTSSLVLDWDSEVGQFSDGGNNIKNKEPNLAWELGTPPGPAAFGGTQYSADAGPGDLTVAYDVPVHSFVTLSVDSPDGGPENGAQQTVSSPAVDRLQSLNAGTPGTDERAFPRGVSKAGTLGATGKNDFDLGAFEFDPHMQAETMIVAAYSTPEAPTVYPAGTAIDNEAFNGKGLLLNPTGANQYMTFFFVAPKDGCYHIWVRAETGKSSGKFQLNYSSTGVAGKYEPWGTYKYPVDLYANTTDTYQTYDLTYSSKQGLAVGSAYYFQVLVTGKGAPTGGGYMVPIDTMDIVFEEPDDDTGPNPCSVP